MYGQNIVLSGTGQEISHRNLQPVGCGPNQNRAVRNALSSDKRWMGHSENNLPIPTGNCNPTIPEHEMQFVQAVSGSVSCNTTLPVSVAPRNAMSLTTTMTVLESPMLTSPSFQGVPTMSAGLQQQNTFQSEPVSLEDLMNSDDPMIDFGNNGELMALPTMDISTPQFNQCPNGGSNSSNGNSGGSQAESGNGGQSHCVTGYSHQNYGPSMVTGGGGGGVGGNGGDDPFNNRDRPLQRDHYADGNVFIDTEEDDLLRIIEGQLEDPTGQSMAFIPTLETSEIFAEIDTLPGGNVTTPGDNMMAYYSKFDSAPGGLQPMEESAVVSNPPPAPTVPTTAATPVTATVTAPVSDSIGNSFDMIKMMKKQRKPPMNRPSDLSFPPPSPAESYGSAPSPAVPPTPSTPQLSRPVQVSTPQRQQVPPQPPQRAPSMPPPSPASPPTPANVRPFDCRRYEEDGKLYLELLVRKDLPEADYRITLAAFFHSVQFCMDLSDIMRNPCDLKVSNHVCANICDFRFDSAQSKLVFSIPSNCKLELVGVFFCVAPQSALIWS